MERAVITGANRGLGLEFARQWVAEGGTVFALARDPDSATELADLRDRHEHRVSIVACDIGHIDSITAAANRIATKASGIDVLIHNAGMRGETGGLQDLDIDEILVAIEINALGPLRLTRALLPLLRADSVNAPRVVHISSLMGSIGDNGSGGSYAYRVSKAALNMVTRNLAHDLEAEGILTVALHPGWVATRMGGPGAPLTVEDAVSDLLATIRDLTADRSGLFLDRDGRTLPY